MLNINSRFRNISDEVSEDLSGITSDEAYGIRLQRGIEQRDVLYTELLRNHKNITKYRNKLKEVHKWIFFWIIIVASIVGLHCIHRLLDRILAEKNIMVILDSIPLLVTALVSFVSTIIAVPLTIAKFLFNAKEDDNITMLIQHTQKHDASSINLFKDQFMTGANKQDHDDSGVDPLKNEDEPDSLGKNKGGSHPSSCGATNPYQPVPSDN